MVNKPPPLVYYASANDYRQHYQANYCNVLVHTFDGLRVFFPRRQFDHAFYESSSRRTPDKSVFCRERAERIDWIAAALQDGTAELYVGWDNKKKALDPHRRVTIVYGDYVVILRIESQRRRASFITAFVGGEETLKKIRSNPTWP